MAAPHPEVEVLGPGIIANSPEKGSFAYNLIRRHNAWEVRQGWGQVAQFDTSMSMDPINADSARWGYRKHLGSYLLKTDFGHRQIVSVFRASNCTGSHHDQSIYANVYCVSIYDLTTRTRWEEVLHRQTSEHNANLLSLEERHGCYETTVDRDYQTFIAADETLDQVFFTEFRGALYFGNERLGLQAYFPAVFTNNRRKFVDAAHTHEQKKEFYSESNLVLRATPTTGNFTDKFAYLNSSEMPNPVDATVLQGRMVYASGRSIYFSDPGFPTAVAADNFVSIESHEEITAIEEHLGALIIWTATESYHYQPSSGALASLGRLSKIHDTVGCLGPSVVTKAQGSVVWCDRTGLYSTAGDLNVNYLSEVVEPFFTSPEGISNPLTSYYTANGYTDMAEEQPNSFLRFKPDGANLCYDPNRNLLLLSSPDEDCTLVFSDGQFAIWSTESQVLTYLTAVPGQGLVQVPYTGLVRNIRGAWHLADGEDLYLVGGIERQMVEDSSTAGNTIINESYYICRYGQGGALDRSAAPEGREDNRQILGKYLKTPVLNADGHLYIDPWVPVPDGYDFGQGTVAEGGRFYFVPLSVVPPIQGADFDRYVIRLRFDNDNWRPVLRSGISSEILVYLPTERLGTLEGFSPGSPVAGSAEAQLYDSGTGTAAYWGDELRLLWNGNVSAASWQHYPHLNLTKNRKNPILWIPMVKLTSLETSGMGWELYEAKLMDTDRLSSYNLDLIAWTQWHLEEKVSDNSKAQPVDWLYQAADVGPKKPAMYKARGLYLRALSHGQGDDPLTPEWEFGLLNVVFGADHKQWISQVVDYAGGITGPGSEGSALQEVRGKETLRSRIWLSDDNLVRKVFVAAGVGPDAAATWGDPSDPSAGNYLIDDEEFCEVAISDSVKGSSFSITLFGHMQDRAERLKLESAQAAFIPYEGRRRTGR